MMYEVALREPYFVMSFSEDNHPISVWLVENVNKPQRRHSLVLERKKRSQYILPVRNAKIGHGVSGVLFDDFSDALLFTLVFQNDVVSGIKQVVAYK